MTELSILLPLLDSIAVRLPATQAVASQLDALRASALYCGFPVAAQQLQLAPKPAEPAGAVARALVDAEAFCEAVAGMRDWARDHGASPDAIGGMQAMREKALSQVRAVRAVGEAAVVPWAASASKAPMQSRCLFSGFSKGAS